MRAGIVRLSSILCLVNARVVLSSTPRYRQDSEGLLALASRCLVLMYKVAICHTST
jgi:hypothetical protein